MGEFLKQCNNLMADMDDTSLILDDKDIQVVDGVVQVLYKTDIMHLDVSKEIRRISQVIKDLDRYMKNNIDRDSLSEEEKEELEEKHNEIVNKFVYLRNKQIVVYNRKVKEINKRVEEIRKKIKNADISEDLKYVVDGMDTINECEEVTDKDLQKNKYLSNLDYKKLSTLYDNVSMIEEKLKTDRNPSVDLWFLSNYINEVINELNNKLDEELDLTSITTISERMTFVYDNLIELDVLHEFNRSKMDTIEFSKYSSKLSALKGKFTKLEKKLFEKRKNINNDEFKNYKFELQYLDSKNDILNGKISEYYGKSNSKVLNVLNKYSKKNITKLNEIKNNIDSENLEHNKINELNREVVDLENKNGHVVDDINNPYMLTDFSDVAFYKQQIANIDKLLVQLEKKVSKLEKTITDKNEIKRIDEFINDRQDDIKHIEWVLKDFKKANKMEEYNSLKSLLDKTNEKLDEIYKEYSGKRPLKVTKVVSANKYLFKKYNKRSLIISGLTVMALLTSTVGQLVIPAIMHGNIMLGVSVPALKGLTSLSNNVLGWIIGASKNASGTWLLANKSTINAGTAVISLLKSLAVNSGISVALFSKELILAIKKLSVKMNLSGKLENVKEKHTENVNRTKENFERMKVFLKFESILNEYELIKHEKTFEQFCEEKKIDEEEIKMLNEHIKTYRNSEYFSKTKKRSVA